MYFSAEKKAIIQSKKSHDIFTLYSMCLKKSFLVNHINNVFFVIYLFVKHINPLLFLVVFCHVKSIFLVFRNANCQRNFTGRSE